MKVKYDGGNFQSRGRVFTLADKGTIFDLPKADAEYFITTFPAWFSLVQEPKRGVKEEVVVEEAPKKTRKKAE